MKILLVEDDPTLGEAVMLAARQAGFAIDWARSAPQFSHHSIGCPAVWMGPDLA